jgi:hypothetical protein
MQETEQATVGAAEAQPTGAATGAAEPRITIAEELKSGVYERSGALEMMGCHSIHHFTSCAEQVVRYAAHTFRGVKADVLFSLEFEDGSNLVLLRNKGDWKMI